MTLPLKTESLPAISMRRTYWGVALLTLALLSSFSIADEWTSYLNGRDRTGYTDAKLPADLKLSWVYRAPAKPRQAWEGPRSAPFEGHEMRHRVDFDSSMQVAIEGQRAYFGSTVDNNLDRKSTV